jgi:hypothetical protein
MMIYVLRRHDGTGILYGRLPLLGIRHTKSYSFFERHPTNSYDTYQCTDLYIQDFDDLYTQFLVHAASIDL